MGRNAKIPIRVDWEKIKLTIIYKAVYKKFETDEDIRKIRSR